MYPDLKHTPSDADLQHTGALHERPGIPRPATTHPIPRTRRIPPLQAHEALRGILAGDRATLARAITLIESRAPAHRAQAATLLRHALPHSGKSIRIGITGVPGAGKSTFIEHFGKQLCDHGHKLAVLAVDPTSALSGGSILGDKTRMEELSRHPNAYIRPTPAGATLGGVAAKTREAMLLCEAAGYDTLFIETVGVGQSETAVRTMTDLFLLLQIAGAGDELQGIKKGVIEMADAIIITKADGDNHARAQAARHEYARILHYLTPYTPRWTPQAIACSAPTGAGLPEIRQLIQHFHHHIRATGTLETRRQEQNLHWFHALLKEHLLNQFFEHPAIRKALPPLEHAVAHGTLPVAEAIDHLLKEPTPDKAPSQS
ncbi:MAG: methylmalonyl Co-A mutase-associated GTPase MeaB [Puniceicoccales bacterium]|jgi:LAO/AO transport system kinase|nr:methylmalonyl Co-A mutase-associated GTPase MeaB [Puniceicoccales bacterium]